jgi:hypothetical protein
VSVLVGLDRLTWQVSTLGRHVDALGRAPGPHLGNAGRGNFGWLVAELGLGLAQLALQLCHLGVQCSLAALLAFDLDEALDCVTGSLRRTLLRLHGRLEALADQRLQGGRSRDRFSSCVVTDLAEDERGEDVARSRPIDADPLAAHLLDREALAGLQDRAVVSDLCDVVNF